MNTRTEIGYCKEYGNKVYEEDIIDGYEIYECLNCKHPHLKCELWDWNIYEKVGGNFI